ncbi:hypothetical protein [Dysgonomonas sp. HGC4]|uniref:hypothetical protein n=2 Tax=Dysgonomonas sp. HGC4 TaxID=1658009 RepID=UPI0017818872|nr:hypothetical protein [Dysgonomonas sp. HGC4]MBD8346632.1 hypothetical protein [Dysgonomonas sp. HGC4]
MNKFLLVFIFCVLTSFSVFAADYYWVGGGGNWSDINHWRTSSGGTGIPGVVPGPTDDVFFDANSGFTASSKTVTINVVANCRNITFAGLTILPTVTSGSANHLNIYGSSVWQTGMTISTSQINYQNTGTNKTITSNGVSSGRIVYFLETSSVSLMDDFKITSNIYFNAGVFNTNNHNMDIGGSFYGDQGTAPRTLNLGSSDIYIRSFYMYMNSTLLTLNAGTSTVHFVDSNIAYLHSAKGQTYYNVFFENPNSTLSSIQAGGGTAADNVKFNRVEYKGDGSIYGYNTFKELVFAPSKSYLLVSSATQTITGSLIAESECVGWISIQSATEGVNSTLSMAATAEVKVSGVVLTNIRGIGGANFTANNSVDNGGNTGWTFITSPSPDLYWVGGSGDWNDKAHWSLTSGGVGGVCVPSPTTNVFFDAGSGFTSSSKEVTFRGSVYCRNIVFDGSAVPPTVNNPNVVSTINIYGSSVWQAGMKFDAYYVYYKSTGVPKTIKSNGVTTGVYYTHFNEASSISLLDDFKTPVYLYINAGTFNTNNHRVEVSQLIGNVGTVRRTLNLGSSHLYIDAHLNLATAVVTLNAGTSHIHFTGTSGIFYPYAGQQYYDVTYENVEASSGSIAASTAGSVTNTVKFNRVEYKRSGYISGYNTFNELILAPGRIYTVQSATNQEYIQTINKGLFVEAECLGWASIKSSVAGYPATLSMPASAQVKVSGTLLTDIKATGGANFTARNSLDNGGNTGWTFVTSASPDLYWVGGAGEWNDASHWSFTSGGTGGACVPSPTSNVFFDAGSGFTLTSKIITIEGAAYCRDITFAGAATPPTISALSSTMSLNIYGSSVWQRDMVVDIYTTNYQNNGTPKTITTNGVKAGLKIGTQSSVQIYETSSVSLLDDLYLYGRFLLYAGTFNTNNNRVDAHYFFSGSGTASRAVNLGSSDIYVFNTFNTNSSYITVNAGTSHIHMTNLEANFIAYTGQVFYDLTFEYKFPNIASITTALTSPGKEVQFNRVEFKGTLGSLSGHNVFNELFLTAGGTYTLTWGEYVQTVKNRLTMSGNTCQVLFVKSSSAGQQANLNLLGGRSDFNFVNIKDINATGGLTLHFRDKSTVAGQNNTNITYDAYNSGEFNGFPSDWTCHFIDTDISTSYTLTADGFFGNEYTEYIWTKVGDPNFPDVIGTESSIDLRTFGYGTYRVQVKYNATCIVSGLVTIIKRTDNVDGGVQPSKVCLLPVNTLANVSVVGENIKWYATAVSTYVLPLTTVLKDGATYYVTQTINNCESGRVPITIRIGDCTSVYVNPNLRMRVPM